MGEADTDTSPPRPGRRSVWVRGVVFVVLIVAAAVVAVLVGRPDVEAMRHWLATSGPLAAALFVAVYAAMTLTPMPKNVLSALAGAIFGFAAGLALVYVGAMIGALMSFWLGRTLGRDAVVALAGARVARLDDLLTRRGTLSIIIARLIPVLPFTVVNYGSGLSGVRLRDYVVGTVLGIAPGTVIFVAVGAFALTLGLWPAIVSMAALLIVSAVWALLLRRSRRS